MTERDRYIISRIKEEEKKGSISCWSKLVESIMREYDFGERMTARENFWIQVAETRKKIGESVAALDRMDDLWKKLNKVN